MPKVLSVLVPYLQGSAKTPPVIWLEPLLTMEANVYITKDKFFQLFVFKCCDLSNDPPTLKSIAQSSTNWANCFLLLPLLPTVEQVELLEKRSLLKHVGRDFAANVGTKLGKTARFKLDAVQDYLRNHYQAQIDELEREIQASEGKANDRGVSSPKQKTKPSFSVRQLGGLKHKLASVGPAEMWGLLIQSRQHFAHTEDVDFAKVCKLADCFIQDLGSRVEVRAFLDACASVLTDMARYVDVSCCIFFPLRGSRVDELPAPPPSHQMSRPTR
jgi:hypothetical protein